ncbi:MAG: family efflux transporter permease subunit [Gammaproteobacteria bacterium]|nr:family efflux transporter permease subunit [Gammaproteobacteria bacterium]
MSQISNANRWVLFGISLACFLGLLDLTIVNTALPAIQQEFHSNVLQLQWVMNSVLLSLTTSMAILAKLADTHGRRLFLYIGLAVFAISSLGIALSHHLGILIGFRFLQGIAIALLYIVPLSIIPNIFPLEEQGKATGVLVGISGFGLALGPAVGGILVSTVGWRWIFWVNLPLALVCYLCCIKTLKESKSVSREPMDWSGFCLLVLSIPTLILAIIESQRVGLFSWQVLSLLSISIVGLISLYRVENKMAFPIIQFSLPKHPLFLTGLIANVALAAFYAVDFFLIPLYLHSIKNYSGSQIGFTLLPATLLVAILSPVVGRIVDKRGPKDLLMVGLLLLLCSALLQTQFREHTTIILLFISYGLFGIGWACILSPALAAALSSVPAERSGVAAGMMGTSHNLGGAIGLACGSLLMQHAQNFLSGYASALWFLVIVMVIVACAIGMLIKTKWSMMNTSTFTQ